ncbi:type II secretion system F family protein [Brevifollis gellanilyticus]|uniref:Type II secretion system protein F n=1 Tax=Brevifollis gellanilyticus TaxID=748831 RepID=A0A512M7M1_9BACT|nr:type II secretion system F family protein [Brevifollis gellanilyticus]GEP42730.1 type II secretion system protein F [Brevifollis gellanilyticus]
MPNFAYTALNTSGQTVSGSLAVGSRAEAYRKLESQSLTPVKVAEESKSAKAASSAAAKAEDNTPTKLKRSQVILFTEELADMLDGGLQIDQALRVITERQEDPALKKVSNILRDQLREGSTVAKALKKASPSFDELYCNLVAAGEVSGSLAPILRRLAQNLTVIAELQSKVTQAMIYPAFLVGACIVLMIVFMTVMVPQITDLLDKNNQQLPMATQMLITFNTFFMKWWWAMLAVIVIVSLSFKAYIATPKGLMWWHQTKINLPLFGPVLATRFYAQFAHSMGSLVGHGVPLLNSIRLVSKISANVFIQSLLARVTGLVAEGSSLSSSLKKVSHFPMMLVDMIAVGEQTGALSKSLEKAATRYDKELDKRIKRMTAMISPIIILFMAVIVGVVAYSIISAVFSSVNGIRGRV